MKIKKIAKIWPFFLILGVNLCFFWQFFFKGRIPLPADITVGMYFPWLDYKWGYLVGVPVKNSLISDSISQFFPFKLEAINQIKNGIVPLWNQSLFGGYPLLANIQAGVLNPTNFFYFLLPTLSAWGLQTFFQPFLAALFTYLFLRSFKLSKQASILGGIIYAFSGFNLIWMELNIHGFATAFFPLFLFSIKKYLEKGDFRFGVLTSVSICLQIFSGYPQITIYSMIAAAFFIAHNYLTKDSRSIKKMFILSIFILLGISLASIQVIPTGELFLLSQRRLESLNFNSVYLPWQYLVSFFFPDYFGNPVTGNFWGFGDYTAISGYSGIVAVILSGVGAMLVKRKKIISFFLLLSLFCLLFGFPTPFSHLWFKFNFFGLGNSGATRIFFLFNFSLACLAAFGLQEIIETEFKWKYLKSFYLTGIFGAGFIVANLLVKKLLNIYKLQFSESVFNSVFGQMEKNLNVGLRNLILPFFIILTTFVLFILLRIKNRLFKSVIVLIIILIAIGELFRFGWKFTPFERADLVYPETPVLKYLEDLKLKDNKLNIFRAEGWDTAPMNMLEPYGIETFSSYDPMYPLRIAQFISIANGESVNNPQSRYGQFKDANSKLLDLSNVCYLLALKSDEKAIPSEKGMIGYKLRVPKFEGVFDDKSVEILKNKDCLPRALFIRDVKVEDDSEKISKILSDKNFNPLKTLIIEEMPQENVVDTKGEQSDIIEWNIYKPGSEEIGVSIKSSGFLFISESYYPGWKAYVDNKETKIYRSNFVFRSIFVPAGEHDIKFIFDPVSFKIGKIISGISLAILLILLFLRKKLPLFKKKFK